MKTKVLPTRGFLPRLNQRTCNGGKNSDGYFLRGRRTVSVYCRNYLCGWKGRRVVLVDTDLDSSVLKVDLAKALKDCLHHLPCPKCKDQSVQYGKEVK